MTDDGKKDTAGGCGCCSRKSNIIGAEVHSFTHSEAKAVATKWETG